MNESYSAWKEKPGRKTEIGVNLKSNICLQIKSVPC